jgi:hypothetical protein
MREWCRQSCCHFRCSVSAAQFPGTRAETLTKIIRCVIPEIVVDVLETRWSWSFTGREAITPHDARHMPDQKIASVNRRGNSRPQPHLAATSTGAHWVNGMANESIRHEASTPSHDSVRLIVTNKKRMHFMIRWGA